jgi:hypothetical protein
MCELSERDKIIIDLKSELFNIQQNSKNIQKLEKTNYEYQNENQLLHETNNKLEFILNNLRDQTSKQIYELESEIKNLNEDLSQKKETNIKLFIENENLEKKVEFLSQENHNLSQKIKNLMNQEEENKKAIEKYERYLLNIKINESNYNHYNNKDIEKNHHEIKKLKQKYEKHIFLLQKKIDELQSTINHLYCDNKKLVKIYKISHNNKEINDNIIFSLINSNLLPKNIIQRADSIDNVSAKKNDRINTNIFTNFNKDSDAKINYQSRTKTPGRDSVTFQRKIMNKNISRSGVEDDIGKKSTSISIYNSRKENELFNPYGYDINKPYNFNKMKKLNKSAKNMLLEKTKINGKENINENINFNFNNSIFLDNNNNIYCNELTKTQEEIVTLKKKILKLVKQNENLINEIDSIVQISGNTTIDVTSEGIKHLKQIIFNNRELLDKYINEVKYKQT